MKKSAIKRIFTSAALCFGAMALAVSGLFISKNNDLNAGAQTSTSTANTVVSEITLPDYATRTDNLVFDGDSLKDLYSALTGGVG